MTIGIYKIKNMVNGKIYIGSSNDIERRFRSHKLNLNKNQHRNNHLQNSWNKYGENNFTFHIVEVVDHEEDLFKREQYYIDSLNVCNEDIGYNISSIAAGGWGKGELCYWYGKGHLFEGELNPFYGKNHTEEAKRKMSENRVITEEHKEKLSLLNSGEGNPKAKLNKEKVKEIRYKAFLEGISDAELSIEYNVSESTIGSIRRFKSWKDVKVDIPSDIIEKVNKDIENKKGSGNQVAKLKEEDVLYIKSVLFNNISVKEIAKLYDVNEATIYYIKRGKTWTHVIADDSTIGQD